MVWDLNYMAILLSLDKWILHLFLCSLYASVFDHSQRRDPVFVYVKVLLEFHFLVWGWLCLLWLVCLCFSDLAKQQLVGFLYFVHRHEPALAKAYDFAPWVFLSLRHRLHDCFFVVNSQVWLSLPLSVTFVRRPLGRRLWDFDDDFRFTPSLLYLHVLESWKAFQYQRRMVA